MAAQVAGQVVAPAQQSMTLKPNKEGEDIDPPLPSSWTLDRLKSGELPVRIFGDLPSPSNQRLRFLLKFYEIPYAHTAGAYTKVDPSYEYKKMPVMRIGTKDMVAEAYKSGDPEKGRLINDGYVIIKALAPILQGRPFTDEEIEVEKVLTFGLQYSMIVDAVKGGKFSGSVVSKMFPNDPCPKVCCIKCCFGCCCPYCVCPCCCNDCCCGGGKVGKTLKGNADEFKVDFTKPGDKQSYVDTGKRLAEKLGDKEFFAGASHGLVDVDLFGILHHNARKLKLPTATALVEENPRLKAWFDRMDKLAGHIDHFANLEFKDNKS